MSLRHELEERDEILRMVQAENELALDEQKKRNSEVLARYEEVCERLDTVRKEKEQLQEAAAAKPPVSSMQGFRNSAVVGDIQRSRSPMYSQQSVGNGLQRNQPQVYASIQSSKERKWSKAQLM